MIGFEYLWLGCFYECLYIFMRQYVCLVCEWVILIGLELSVYGIYFMWWIKVVQIYCKIGNLCVVQFLLGYMKMDSMVCYFGIEFEDVLIIVEVMEI